MFLEVKTAHLILSTSHIHIPAQMSRIFSEDFHSFPQLFYANARIIHQIKS